MFEVNYFQPGFRVFFFTDVDKKQKSTNDLHRFTFGMGLIRIKWMHTSFCSQGKNKLNMEVNAW